MTEIMATANTVSDDVLVNVFKHLSAGWGPHASQKAASSRFIWFRNTLPLVCKRWHRLALGTPALWTSIVIDPAAEALHVKRSARHDLAASFEEPPRVGSGSSTPARGSSPLPGTSPDSDAGGYWTSHYAPYQVSTVLPGGSPSASIRQHLNRLSIGRHHHRCSLSAHAVLNWLQQHPAAASGAGRLLLDLSHHSYHNFDRQQLDSLMGALPQLSSVTLVGAVDGTDAYEPLGRLRNLHSLELSCASQACLDGGLLALGFLPCLQSLSITLDIHPASPWCLGDLPTGLASLKLGSMWLEAVPNQLTELTGLTSVVLERCQIENNPVPLLLTLPQLASLTIMHASRTSSSSSSSSSSGEACQLVPMHQPQQQLEQLVAAAAAANRHGKRRHHRYHNQQQQQQSAADAGSNNAGGGVRRGLGGFAAGLGGVGVRHRGLRSLRNGAAEAMPAGAPLTNTSITSLSMIDVGLQQLPACVTQLLALQDLNLAWNHEMGLNPAACLPQELTCLSGLSGLCLGHCSLGQLPSVVACLTGLTRLELRGNALSSSGFGLHLADVGFKHSLKVLDLGGQGTGRGSRMRGIPAWVGGCCALRELCLGCHCLGYGTSSSSLARTDGVAAGMSASLVRQSAFASATNATSGLGGCNSSTNAVGSSGAAERSAGGGERSPGVNGYYSTYTFTHSPQAGGSSSSLARTSGGLASTSIAAGGSVHGSSSSALAEGLTLQQLPELLPQLEVLCIEGGVWEHRAVRDALALVRHLERQGSKLQVVLPV